MANNFVSATSDQAGRASVTADNTGNGPAVWATAKPDGRGVVALSTTGVGLWGETQNGRAIVGVVDADGTGVWGETQTGRAIVGVCDQSGTGVWGETQSGRAIVGVCDQSGTGVWGETKTGGSGVVGTSPNGDGVVGNGKRGLVGTSPDGDGVVGTGVRGVVGESSEFQGVFGHSVKNAGVVGVAEQFHAIWAETHAATSAGVYARNTAGGNAGWMDGPLLVSGSLTVNGDVFLPGADYAEQMPAVAGVHAGDCVVIDDDARVVPCASDYDTRVAGIVSGAGGLRPAVVLDHQTDGAPIALMGKAFVRVDADRAAVRIGDLLTTSSTPGHAMRVGDSSRAANAVIGKALSALPAGRGFVKVLVSGR